MAPVGSLPSRQGIKDAELLVGRGSVIHHHISGGQQSGQHVADTQEASLEPNQTDWTETVFREAGSRGLGHQRSQRSDGGVEGTGGTVAGTQREGSPNQRRGHLFSFFSGWHVPARILLLWRG